MPTVDLLHDLEPTAAALFDRHLAATKEWFPHELVPYGRARDFTPGAAWSPADTDCGGVTLSEAARSALYLNVLTEDNLPYYFNDIRRTGQIPVETVQEAWDLAQQKLKEQGKDKDYTINIMPHATKIMPILQDK